MSGQDIICVDLGTTNTRLWRIDSAGQILHRAQAQVGVRDSAREGSSTLLRRTLKSLINAAARIGNSRPSKVIAAGMITSALGLLEVPHVPAPAGLAEMAAATRSYQFADVTDLPFLLVPGVRSGASPQDDLRSAGDFDLMRGEETLCLGLISRGFLSQAGVVLNLGSHWKMIFVDAAGHITRSTTSLAGEMIHAIQSTTILASALPAERPELLDMDWVSAGMKAQRRDGLARSLFGVRLLQLTGPSTANQRYAYLIGAFIATDMDSIKSNLKLEQLGTMLVVGNAALASAWISALETISIPASIISHTDVEAAMLAALAKIATYAG